MRGNTSISIHAPHAGSDVQALLATCKIFFISIHAPHAGSDAAATACIDRIGEFQSTLPMRGATAMGQRVRRQKNNFNPRSPCGERLTLSEDGTFSIKISIHAPHTGSDEGLRVVWRGGYIFQSTLPIRGATLFVV